MDTGKGMTDGRVAIQIAAVAADGRGCGCCLRQIRQMIVLSSAVVHVVDEFGMLRIPLVGFGFFFSLSRVFPLYC